MAYRYMNTYEALTDEQIVEIVRTKDHDVFAYIIHRYEKKLLRYATYLINDEHMASDAVQESFIKAYINLRSFDLSKKFSSWMYRIVHNEAMNIVGKQKQYMPLDTALDIHDDIDIEDVLVKKELIEHVQDCVNKMPILYKAPLTLFFLEDRSYEDISDILRIPMGTVATRINRAKSMMRSICQKKNM